MINYSHDLFDRLIKLVRSNNNSALYQWMSSLTMDEKKIVNYWLGELIDRMHKSRGYIRGISNYARSDLSELAQYLDCVPNPVMPREPRNI